MERSTCQRTTLRSARMQSSEYPARTCLLVCLGGNHGRDINALIEYIGSGLSGELDPSRIAVMGGSCEYFLSTLDMNAKYQQCRAQMADTWSL